MKVVISVQSEKGLLLFAQGMKFRLREQLLYSLCLMSGSDRSGRHPFLPSSLCAFHNTPLFGSLLVTSSVYTLNSCKG